MEHLFLLFSNIVFAPKAAHWKYLNYTNAGALLGGFLDGLPSGLQEYMPFVLEVNISGFYVFKFIWRAIP